MDTTVRIGISDDVPTQIPNKGIVIYLVIGLKTIFYKEYVYVAAILRSSQRQWRDEVHLFTVNDVLLWQITQFLYSE